MFKDFIFNYLPLEFQINFKKINKNFYKLKIKDLYHISSKIQNKLTINILKKYPDIEKIKLSFNEKINNLNFLKKLKILKANGVYNKISNSSIDKLILKVLKVKNNYRINNIDHMKELKSLDAGGLCGIKNINNNNLTKLKISNNKKIFKINHLTNLKILCLDGSCNIKNDQLKNLNLEKLSIDDNWYIKNISFLKNLKILILKENMLIGPKLFNTNLIVLDLSGNSHINDISNLIKLKKLKISDMNSLISDKCLNDLDLTYLDCSYNPKIKKPKCQKLIKLKANGICSINQSSILNYTNLTYLSLLNNNKIDNVEQLVNLNVLKINKFNLVKYKKSCKILYE